MSKRICVINFSDDAGNFKFGQTRLVESLRNVGYNGDFQLYNSHYQLGCKPHAEVPYQFKVYAIHKAYKDGYDIVLYCDSSIFPIKNITPCLEYIEQNGYLFELCGFYLGQWCTDVALNKFGITRDEAFKMPMHSAGFTGLDFSNEKSKEFIEQWFEYAKNEETFKGAWNNNNNEVSTDPRCSGHRHDQSVATYLANKLEMKAIAPYFMQYKYENSPINDSSIFFCQGI
jgi:hypothetical protein